MPHLLITEDDPAIAQTLLYALKQEGHSVSWAKSVGMALAFLEKEHFDAILLDVGLPDGTGFELCQKIRFEKKLTTPVLFLSAKGDELERVMGLEMGADDYVVKPFSPRELIARIKAVWRRQSMQQTPADTPLKNDSFEKTLGGAVFSYDAPAYRLSLNGTPLPLSPTERLLLLALLANPSHILSREQLLSAISEHPEHRLARTVDAHIKSLRQKLFCVYPFELITTHRGVGYGLC